MSRPTSVLICTPDPISGKAFWARWWGSPWHYMLSWGDGTSDELAFWEPAKKHAYPQVDTTYTITAEPDLPGGQATTCTVTTRAWRTPNVTFELVTPRGNEVRARLPQVGGPVHWRIDWGDGTIAEHHSNDPATHEYPWNFGTPTITVTDVPSSRTRQFTGPEIGPDPTPPDIPVRGFLTRFLRATSNGWVYEVLGGGLTPGDEVWFYPTRSWGSGVQMFADSRGKVRHEFTHSKSNLGHEFDDAWKSYTIWTKARGYRFLHVQPVLAAQDEPQVTYTVSPSNALDVEINVTSHQLGTHWVNFGDGAEVRVPVEELPLSVTHNYGYQRPTGPITVWFPDGRKAERKVESPDPCAPCFNPHYPGECSIIWYRSAAPKGCDAPCGGDAEVFAPVYITNGGTHVPHVLHKPNNGDGWGTGWAYSGFGPGYYSFRYLSFDWDRNKGVEILKSRRSEKRPDAWLIVEAESEPSGIWPYFHPQQAWEGGYSGEFVVSNTSQEASTPWLLEFELPKDAHAAEVWPADRYELAKVADGRWRVSCETPIPAFTDARVGVRVEPSGKTKAHPGQMRAREKPREQ